MKGRQRERAATGSHCRSMWPNFSQWDMQKLLGESPAKKETRKRRPVLLPAVTVVSRYDVRNWCSNLATSLRVKLTHKAGQSLQGERPATLILYTRIPRHSGFLIMLDCNLIAVSFCWRGSILLLAAESLLIHTTCPIGFLNLKIVISPSWSIFLQAKNSRHIKDQPI